MWRVTQLAALALVVIAAGCAGEERVEVDRVTVDAVPQTPGSTVRFGPLTLTGGEAFERFSGGCSRLSDRFGDGDASSA